MKLFLCGGGSSKQILSALYKFSNIIEKNKPILYIPLAMASKNYDSCYTWFKNEIKIVNLSKFEMVKSSYELSQKNFNEYSALFIGGGNTYKLLYELSQYDNFNKIKAYLKNGGIVFGGSAGAIIFGKDIDGCLLEDENKFKIDNIKGFNYLNGYSLLCHLKNKNFNKNLKYLQKYSLKNKLIYLPEENVIFINDNKICIIGTSKYVIFKNGKYMVHNFANFKKDIIDN